MSTPAECRLSNRSHPRRSFPACPTMATHAAGGACLIRAFAAAKGLEIAACQRLSGLRKAVNGLDKVGVEAAEDDDSGRLLIESTRARVDWRTPSAGVCSIFLGPQCRNLVALGTRSGCRPPTAAISAVTDQRREAESDRCGQTMSFGRNPISFASARKDPATTSPLSERFVAGSAVAAPSEFARVPFPKIISMLPQPFRQFGCSRWL